LKGLEVVHAKGVVHGAINTDNIFIFADGSIKLGMSYEGEEWEWVGWGGEWVKGKGM
jgi:hypothetical protein